MDLTEGAPGYPGLEVKFCRPEGGLSLQEGAVVAGYASLFGETDQGGDVVEPGAYAGGLARLAARGGRVRMLWQHDPGQPIGIWDEVREDGRGLWVKGRLLPEVARAREAAALVAAGAIDGLSIGYRTVSAAKAAGGRRLLDVDLWEVSLVTFPMLATARLAPAAKAAAADEDGGDWSRLAAALDRARAELSAG
ncbi:HK97 family phage prohead protease [Frigidibacter oleivorans]|uniref:HK97 family phage prohead protease n=1 Tax=Frigidibacter oleivorans TaxID=2487129 RepID=UPI000F8CE1A7|nr:HK97 family phage prohead protease [Frigidibacter oleivorans]